MPYLYQGGQNTYSQRALALVACPAVASEVFGDSSKLGGFIGWFCCVQDAHFICRGIMKQAKNNRGPRNENTCFTQACSTFGLIRTAAATLAWLTP